MFTIKHIGPDGFEFAVEAVSYSVEPVPSEVAFGAINIRILGYNQPHMSGEHVGLWFGQKEHGAGPGHHAVYVMNSKGATIAAHYFSDATQMRAGEANADPACLAAASTL